MQLKHDDISSHEPRHIFQKPGFKVFVVAVLFISAFVIRLHHITSPPLDFQLTRQYMLAHNTRAPFFESLESIPEWKKELARINKKRMGFEIEAPILDNIIVSGYHVLGGEHLWIPRVLSSIFWMVGGIFLYLIAGKMLSPGAALFSAVFYLFLPFGISASRSFQPDPLMIMLLLFSIFMILRYYERESLLRLIMAASISSMAMFIKPYCVFIIFAVFIAVAVHKRGIRKLLSNRDFLIFIFLSPLPGAFYYLSVLLTEGAFLQEQANASFLPNLLLRPFFWKDWLAMILRVVGLFSFAGAFLGLFLVPKGRTRALLTGMWTGYFIFGLLFTFHIHTHDYYQLQFIPVIALSLGTTGALILKRIFSAKKGVALFMALSLGLISGIGINAKNAQHGEYGNFFKIFNYVVGVNPQFYKFITEDFERELRVAKEIGEIVGHNTNALLLTTDFGRSLTYHGELSGLPWPTSTSLYGRKIRGIKISENDELFNGRYFTIRTHARFIQYIPDYFIITDFEEFERQPELKHFLYDNYPVLAQSDDYLIFNMEKMKLLQNGSN